MSSVRARRSVDCCTPNLVQHSPEPFADLDKRKGQRLKWFDTENGQKLQLGVQGRRTWKTVYLKNGNNRRWKKKKMYCGVLDVYLYVKGKGKEPSS